MDPAGYAEIMIMIMMMIMKISEISEISEKISEWL